MKKAVVFVFIMFLVQGIGFAQNKKMDSLKVELKNAKQDTTRLNLYLTLCKASEFKDYRQLPNQHYLQPTKYLMASSVKKNERE